MNCGPLSVQYVHRSHGNRLSLTRARKLCSTTRNGTRTSDMVDALSALGYSHVRLRQNLSWWELKRLVERGNDVIVGWWSDVSGGNIAYPADGHYSVAKRVTRDTITIYDPDPEEEVTMPRKFFEARWYDWERDTHAGQRTDFIRSAVIAKYGKRKRASQS